MAQKEATVFIIDQGLSMGDCASGRVESNLDFGMRYVWDQITGILALSRKTLNVGVVGLRTSETNGPLAEEDGYENISVMQELGPITMESLRRLQAEVKPSDVDDGDAISAIVVAIDMIVKFTKHLKYAKKIVLMTDAMAPIDGEQVESIYKKINDEGIELVVMGIDFDDADFGFKEEDKDRTKEKNESLLRQLADGCEKNVFGTAAEAVAELSVPRVKITKPYRSYEGQLCLGDPEIYDTAMSIDVERYFRTKQAKPVSASSFVAKSDMTGESLRSSNTMDVEMGGTEGAGLTAVKNARTYRVNDETAPGGKRDVEREELAKGYEYGRTAVHISESDENVTKLETFRSFSIIGFIPNDKYAPYLNMGESCITLAQRTNDKARLAFSSLIRALHELDTYAVARMVGKDGKEPQLLLLAPSIEADAEALIDVPLPFAEDVRLYRFPPLDRVVTASGQILKKHRNLPSDDLIDAMDAYVDSMDLSEFDTDEDGNPAEYAQITDTFSPVLHRINQAIRFRASHPNEPVPPVAPILTKYSQPPSDLVTSSAPHLSALVAAADVKKVPPKARGKRNRETVKPLSGLDVDSLLSNQKRTKISGDNAIPEFKQMLATTENVDGIKDAARQLGDIAIGLIMESKDGNYGRVAECLRVMREELRVLEEPGIWNGYIQELKTLIFDEKLGDRRDLWVQIRKLKLGLIDVVRCEVSDVTEEEAEEFYSTKSSV